jgi:predicted nuclease of predicted toxin-antitoxin system
MIYYLDVDLSWRIARLARNLGVDVISANDVGMRTATDRQQIAEATERGRCIITRNRDDFIALDRLYQAEGVEHAGILMVAESLPAHEFAAVARALAHHSSLHPEPFIPGLVAYLHPAPEPNGRRR